MNTRKTGFTNRQNNWLTAFNEATVATTLILTCFGTGTTFADTGKLANLVVTNFSPAFDPAIKQYTVPKTANCALPITATLADTSLNLYVASNLTTSGATVNAWVCDGKTEADIVVYQNWTEVDRYNPAAKISTARHSCETMTL